MMARLQGEWLYNKVSSNAVNGLLEEGLVCESRAEELKDLLGDRDRMAASLASVEAGRVENVAMALACDCALLYQSAANDPRGREHFLKIAARAMMLEELPEPFIRVSMSALMDKSRRLSWESAAAAKAC